MDIKYNFYNLFYHF